MASWSKSLAWNLKYQLGKVISLFYTLAGSFLPLIHVAPQDLEGKIAIVTGANSGLGYSIALALAKQNATVYLACRNKAKGEKAASEIIDATGSKNVHVVELDTSSMQSVRQFASSWSKKIDILANNAGAATTDPKKQVTDDGLGMIYATNFAGSFLLTDLLEQRLAPKARIVFTSSVGSYSGKLKPLFEVPGMAITRYQGDQDTYGDTKLFQVIFARALQQRADRLGLDYTAHAFSPGFSSTPIFDKLTEETRSFNPFFVFLQRALRFSISSDQGAATGVWLATTNDPAVLKGGDYWDRCRKFTTRADNMTPELIGRTWQLWCIDSGATWTYK